MAGPLSGTDNAVDESEHLKTLHEYCRGRSALVHKFSSAALPMCFLCARWCAMSAIVGRTLCKKVKCASGWHAHPYRLGEHRS